jgi:hypothetical protein
LVAGADNGGMAPLLGPPRTTLPEVRTWARARITAAGRPVPPHLVEALDALWSAALQHGIVPEAMIAQACMETAFLTFLRPDGTPSPALKAGYRNTCGLKPRDGAGADEPHAQFATWWMGARAHAQHLCGYLGVVIAETEIVDPRYVWVGPGTGLFGTVRTVEDLGGKWAPDPGYGSAIVRNYLSTMPGWQA